MKNDRPFGWVNPHVGIKVAYLPPCMRSAIGSACSKDLVFFARDTANSFFQCALNSSLPSLCGPATKVSTVVRNDELNSHEVGIDRLQSSLDASYSLVDELENGLRGTIASSRSDLG